MLFYIRKSSDYEALLKEPSILQSKSIKYGCLGAILYLPSTAALFPHAKHSLWKTGNR